MIKSLELGQELVPRNITTLREGKTPPFILQKMKKFLND